MNKTEYKNMIAFHPGYYVSEIIEDMGITHEEFAKRLDITPKTLSLLVNGNAKISEDIAKKLSTMLNTSVEFWFNLQKKYDDKIIDLLSEINEM